MIDDDFSLVPIRSAERVRLLPLGVTKIYEEINAGRLEAVKVGARSFLRRGEIKRYIAALPRVGAA